MSTTIIPPEHLDALQDLGLTETEALVYTYLLQNEPSTGYKISHAIGKPTANTYKAIASLEQKGALLVDKRENRVVRAVPPSELVAQMERQFTRRRSKAVGLLQGLTQDSSDDRVYSLQTVDQVIERARAMLDRTTKIALLDVFPGPLERLAGNLESAVARNVRVTAKVYGSFTGVGVELVSDELAAEVIDRWPGQQLTLVSDAEEHLIALFSEDMLSVRQAIWSNSTFLSCMHHNHVAAEMIFTPHRAHIQSLGDDPSNLTDLALLTSNPPGLKKLYQRFES